MNILTAPHPMLSTVCRSDFTVDTNTINEMFRLMRVHGDIGLAAPQVGIDARLFVTDWGQVFIRPEIVQVWEPIIVGKEGCLSIPGKSYRVARRSRIKLATGEIFSGLKAIVVQHEVDHLDGKIISKGRTRVD